MFCLLAGGLLQGGSKELIGDVLCFSFLQPNSHNLNRHIGKRTSQSNPVMKGTETETLRESSEKCLYKIRVFLGEFPQHN